MSFADGSGSAALGKQGTHRVLHGWSYDDYMTPIMLMIALLTAQLKTLLITANVLLVGSFKFLNQCSVNLIGYFLKVHPALQSRLI
jgi:hypothetical protein